MSDESTQSSTKALNEQFYRRFQDHVSTLQSQIEQIGSKAVVGGERHDAIEHCLAGIAQLSGEVGEASSYMPAYDQRSYANTIKALSDRLQETRSVLAPKQRFAFKSARKQAVTAQVDPVNSEDVASTSKTLQPLNSHAVSSLRSTYAGVRDSNEVQDHLGVETAINTRIREHPAVGPRRPSFSQATRVVLESHTGIHIILPSSATHATGASVLRQLRNCVVDLSIPSSTNGGRRFAGLTLQDIQGSLIVCGQVAGPIHMTNLEESVLVTTCRQFRMHGCKNVDVYLHCQSRPIIEDCEGIRFAPLPDCYHDDSSRSQPNSWSQVDDFKWLKAEHSPHWSVLPESARPAEQIWRDVVPGGPDLSVNDILAAIRGRAAA